MQAPIPDTTRLTADTLAFFGHVHQSAIGAADWLGLPGPVWPIVLIVAAGIIGLSLLSSILRF